MSDPQNPEPRASLRVSPALDRVNAFEKRSATSQRSAKTRKAQAKLEDAAFYLKYVDLNPHKPDERPKKLAQALVFCREARELVSKRDPEQMTVAATKVVDASYALEERIKNDYGYTEDENR